MISDLNRPGKCEEETPHILFLGSLIFLIYLMALCCLISLCWADPGEKVWYADPNTEIQDLIDVAFIAGGGTVFVKKGHYEEGIIFLREGVSLIGIPEDLGSVVILGNPSQSAIWADSHTTIKNLVIYGGEYGIQCYHKDKETMDVSISNNLIVGNLYGLYIRDSYNVSIINNTIVHNGKSGLFIFIDPNGPVLHVEGNITAFNNPNCGIEFAQQDKPDSELTTFLDLTTLPLTFNYNDLYDTAKHKWFYSNGFIRAQITISPLELFGPGNISADPYFVNPNGLVDPNEESYHLLSYSPCIDRGDPNRDYSLEPLPNGGRINLGFYGNTSFAAASVDTDNDGLKDFQEGRGDMDEDGVPDYKDADTAIIPLSWDTEKISLHLRDLSDDSNQHIRFEDTKVVPSSELTVDPPEGIFPFEAIQFRLTNIDEGVIILIRMDLPGDFGALGASRYLALSSDASWQPLPFEIDQNEKAISFKIEDGSSGDKDGINNGEIEHLAGLVIPHSITWENPGKCFISLVNPFVLDNACVSTLKNHQLWHTHNKGSAYFCLSSLFMALLMICCVSKKAGIGKRCFLAFLISIMALILSSYGWAQLPEDIEIASSPTPVGSGARALGMGGAFIGVADDATAASWNPAGLKHLVRPEISWVAAYSSIKKRFPLKNNPEELDDYHLSSWNINYLSLACPGRLFNRNFVIALNYQDLYDLSKKRQSFSWHVFTTEPSYMDLDYQASYEKSGGLKALSPALAVMWTSRLTFGLTINIWSDKLFTNEWIGKYRGEKQGEIEDNQPVITHIDILKRYVFSGLNFNLGLLWDISETFTLGVVYKTPFKADLDHTYTKYKTEEYTKSPSRNIYIYNTRKDRERLCMPGSYGIGIAYQPMDALVIDLDIYRTEWGDYELIKADGTRIKPISDLSQFEAALKPTHHIRLGAEYAFVAQKGLVPTIRVGTFYDPLPAPYKTNDFYGVSFGFGITFREKKPQLRGGKRKERKDFMSIDMAYQYRWGRQGEEETIPSENSPVDVDRHLLYTSVIYYI